jgi:hypothetical protein
MAQSEPKKKTDSVTRTLRVVVVANRALPVFEKKGDKIIEVEPPASKQPPTSFKFVDAAHAPKLKSDKPKRTSYSSWPNRLVRISHYKGPSVISLQFRSLAQPNQNEGLQIRADLGESLNPLLLIRPDPGNSGWNKPLAEVIDMDSSKFSSGSVLVVNYSGVPIKVYLSPEGEVVKPDKHAVIHVASQTKSIKIYRYRIDASDGKELKTISNSRYKVAKNTRLVILALPGLGASRAGFPLPNIRMITDKL